MIKLLAKSFPDIGLLILRVGLGFHFILHGYPKIVGGPEKWAKVGGAMANLGIDSAPTFWGFMAAISELGGGVLLIAGFLFRPANAALAFTMLVAAIMHHTMGDSYMFKTSRPVELLFVFIGLMFIGPGRFSVDNKLFKDDSQ